MKHLQEHKERRARIIELWREGRSVAGIILEIASEYGYSLAPAQVLGYIRRARKRDRTIPPRDPARVPDALDIRADMTQTDGLGRAANLRHKWHDSGESEGVPCR